MGSNTKAPGKRRAKAPKKAPAAITAARESDPKALYLREEPGLTRAQIIAREVMDGDSYNAITAVTFAQQSMPEPLGITESIAALRSQIAKVNSGDLSQVEAMLYGQANALTSIFHECARRAALNMGQYPEAMERYMRLALKAQSQCRTTLEALIEAKAPKAVAFVRQANIANGHQQVNNGEAAQGRAEIFDNEPNELQPTPVRSLASGAPAAGVRADTGAAAVVEIDRAANARR